MNEAAQVKSDQQHTKSYKLIAASTTKPAQSPQAAAWMEQDKKVY